MFVRIVAEYGVVKRKICTNKDNDNAMAKPFPVYVLTERHDLDKLVGRPSIVRALNHPCKVTTRCARVHNRC
jgi:hypothetical protein